MGWIYAGRMTALLVGGLVLPVLRGRRAGVKPVAVARAHRPIERLAGVGLSMSVGITALWSILHSKLLGEMSLELDAPPGLQIAGLVVIGSGLAVLITGQVQMGPAWRLGIDRQSSDFVQRGLFSRVRHPIYSGFACVFLGAVAFSPAVPTAIVSSIGLVCLVAEARLEEALLLEHLGDPYARYMARTGRFLPRPSQAREAVSPIAKP